jgi:hypothetical protein
VWNIQAQGVSHSHRASVGRPGDENQKRIGHRARRKKFSQGWT